VSRVLKAVDLFCGAGGTSQGAEQSGAARVITAVNHWQRAVETHSANFPHAKHINSRLDQVNPGESDRPDILFASPECTHHSRARGGKPTSDQQRSGAWDLMRWIEYHRPSFLAIENVTEWRDWGPVDPKTGKPIKKYKGKFFCSWLHALKSCGYREEVIEANAADFGAATSRNRLFVLLRLGNRRVPVPEPTHAQVVGGELPGMGGLQRWRSAAEIIDWSIPCPSVFLRATPLADKTLYRIAAGLRKFVGPYLVELRRNMTARGNGDPLSCITAGGGHHGVAVPFQYSTLSSGAARGIDQPTPTFTANGSTHLTVPFLAQFDNKGSPNGGYVRSIDRPLHTLTTKANAMVAVPYIFGCGARDGQSPPKAAGEPLNTIVTKDAKCVAVPYVFDTNHGDDGHGPGARTRSIDEPLATVTKRNGQYIAVPFVVTYYNNGKAYSIDNPLCTLSTRDRCGLAMAIIETAPSIEPRTDGERHLYQTMIELGVRDLGYRMLTNPELSLAMSFPASYIFHGNKGEVTKQIGNAVAPNVAAGITTAFAGAA